MNLVLSGRRLARPKSLAISTPTKLLSLEEARQKAVASCSAERQQVYLDVGGGPANLPPVYHTVIDLPKGFALFVTELAVCDHLCCIDVQQLLRFYGHFTG